jgi:hypothetical protein
MKKMFFITSMCFVTSCFSQVGIGTTTPNGTLHIKNITNDANVINIEGFDNQNKFRIKEDGTIYISEPFYDDTIGDILGYDFLDGSIKLINKSSLRSTGLERINEGNGDGWRLIGRNANNYGNIGFNAVDFSLSENPSTLYGAKGKYSFIGPGVDNFTSSNNALHNVILGGSYNSVFESSTANNYYGVSILGGDFNTSFTNQNHRSFILGEKNNIKENGAGNIIGNNNNIFTNSKATLFGNFNEIGTAVSTTPGTGFVFGNGNKIKANSEGFLLGTDNLIDTRTSGYAIGYKNKYGTDTANKGLKEGFIFGYQNEISSGRAFIIGHLNKNNQYGSGKPTIIIGNENYNNQSFEATLIGTGLVNETPFQTVVGRYNEINTSAYGNTGNSDLTIVNQEMPNSYYGAVNEPMFTVGIGFKQTDGSIIRRDGFKVYRNGDVEIKNQPPTNNSLTQLYVRQANGKFALRDVSSIVQENLFKDGFTGVFDSAYLNTNYGAKPIGYQVYSLNDSKIYTKVEFNEWVVNIVTPVP